MENNDSKVLSNFDEIIDFIKSQTEEIEDETDEELIKSDDEEDTEDETDTKKKKGKKKEDDDEEEDDDYEKSDDSEFEDASPILKAVSKNINYNNKKIDTLIEVTNKLIKAMSENKDGNETLIKSIKEDVDKIASEPIETAGVWSAQQLIEKNAVLVKSVGGHKDVDLPIEKNFIKATLLKAVMNKEISPDNVTMFELARPGLEMNALDDDAKNYLRKSISNTNREVR